LCSSGLFYVIEGFLDILLPIEESRAYMPTQAKPKSDTDFWSVPEHFPQAHQAHKLLFTVKPGGIAGYLGTCQASLS